MSIPSPSVIPPHALGRERKRERGRVRGGKRKVRRRRKRKREKESIHPTSKHGSLARGARNRARANRPVYLRHHVTHTEVTGVQLGLFPEESTGRLQERANSKRGAGAANVPFQH